jgi:predicted nucleic acid-binding protein
MKRVFDSCVILKWFLNDRPEEADVVAAMDLFHRVQGGEDEIIQPAHWRAEVLSVLARTEPRLVDSAVDLLDFLAPGVADDWTVYRRAAALSVQLNHHLFDTLYHAVALENDAELITADRKYFNKARGLGSITLLG